MQGILWKTKEGRVYFQAFAQETSWCWGSASYVLSEESLNLLNALKIDNEVEWIITDPRDSDYYLSYTYIKNGIDMYEEKQNTEEEEKELDKEVETIMSKYRTVIEKIVSNDIKDECIEETFGTCELCEYEGTWTYYTGWGEKHEL